VSEKEPAGVQVIARAAQVLRALEGEPHGLSLAQLAERVRLPRSTVHRIVSALAAEGLLMSASATGRVRIGPEFARLAGAGAAEYWRPVEPFMRQLHDQLGETVDCGMLDGTQVRVIHVIPASGHMLRAVTDVGQAFPLASTAKGKALLAAAGEVACDYEEAAPGICAAAIAIPEPSGVLLAISVVAPAQRYYGREAAITGALQAARRAALADFGRF
jgi:DNA-binding IclR family transcriptional regulator